MSDLKAKMHQIRFPLGLRPRPRWRSSQRSPTPPDSLAVFKGPTAKKRGRVGEGGRTKRGRKREAGEEGGREREVKFPTSSIPYFDH